MCLSIHSEISTESPTQLPTVEEDRKKHVLDYMPQSVDLEVAQASVASDASMTNSQSPMAVKPPTMDSLLKIPSVYPSSLNTPISSWNKRFNVITPSCVNPSNATSSSSNYFGKVDETYYFNVSEGVLPLVYISATSAKFSAYNSVQSSGIQ